MIILGIDYGTVHIGLSLGDSETKLAFPFRTIKNVSRTDLVQAIEEIISEEKVEKIIVGEPLAAHTNLPVDETNRSAIQEFAKQLAAAANLPVILVDERFTTEQAKQLKKDGSTATDHELAAMLILQTYLDKSDA